MRGFQRFSIGALLLCATVAQGAETLPALRLERSNPENTKGLTVFAVTLPTAPLSERIDPIKRDFLNYYWQVAAPGGELAQLFFQPSKPGNDKTPPSEITVYGLLKSERAGTLELSLQQDLEDGKPPLFRVNIDPALAQPGSEGLLKQWAEARSRYWLRYFPRETGNLLLIAWLEAANKLYGSSVSVPSAWSPGWPPRRADRPGNRDELSVFSLFSGEAAIEETLQRQLLGAAENSPPAPETADQLAGPEVPSHPFAEMLGDQPGGRLPIADLVPPARYFVHFNTPAQMFSRLQQISDSAAQLAGLSQHGYLQREVMARLLRRLHLTPETARQLSPLARQAALFGPDLLLAEGSDVTVVLETPAANLLEPLLHTLLGIKGGDEVQAYQLLPGVPPAYYAHYGTWRILSTHRSEAEAALALARSNGAGSLGQSAEFRYMLAQLPEPPDTEGILVYLSDPFIRAITGPVAKIGQLRRHLARSRLYALTVLSMLSELDGVPLPPETWVAKDEQLSQDAQGAVHSSVYGNLAESTPLSALPVTTLSESERDIYKSYVKDYSRYWRTFFDPIGVRIRFTPHLRMETLILPLVNNSIYDGLQAAVGGEALPLALPETTPQPLAALSMKMSAREVLRGFVPSKRDDSAPQQWLRAQLGGQLHFAVFDNDPLITLGATDFFSGFAGQGLGGGRDFVWIGMLASFVTQPAALFVQLKSPDSLSQPDELQRFVNLAVGEVLGHLGGRSLSPRLESIGGQSLLVYTVEPFGVVRFHLFAQKVGDYVIFSNWRADFRAAPATAQAEPTPANAALQVFPQRAEKMRGDLLLRQSQQARDAAQQSAAYLLPFLWLGAETPAQAAQAYQKRFGATLAVDDSLRWDATAQVFEDARFGKSFSQLPDYLAAETVDRGPLAGVERFSLRLRFEDSGARIVMEAQPVLQNR